jgi:non-canonical poly(A) RNA polymerase PAPD5/7
MSRLPPLPPGLPPRPAFDSYRPGQARNDRFESHDYDRERERDRDRPSMYQFGSDNYRSPPRNNRAYDNYDSTDRYVPGTAPPALRPSSSVYRQQYDQGPPPGQFTFRHDAPSAISAAKDDMYRPVAQQPRRNNDNRQSNNGYRHGRRGGGQGQGSYRGYVPKMASDRAFLKGNREPTPELMAGMDEDETGVRFKPIEDVSDSEEAEMDMSDDESPTVEQPNSKKARTSGKDADGDSAPRWSNPDPYTALPPPDESQRKKKDVVKLIRKARVETSSASAAKVEAADDFISFDLGDETEDAQDQSYSLPSGIGVVGAPTGPRFSHNTNLHNQQPPSAPASAVSTLVSDRQVQAQVNIQTLHAGTNIQDGPGPVNDQNARTPVANYMNQAHASQNGQPHNNENIRFDFTLPETYPTLAKVSRPSKPVNVDTTSDPVLGSRKRTIRDEIKPAPILHKVGKGVSKKAVNGVVIQEWQPVAGASSTPWVEIDHSDTANMGLW